MFHVLYARRIPLKDTRMNQQMLDRLPTAILEKIMLYKDPNDRQLRITGKLLLIEMIRLFGLEQSISLHDLYYSEHNRPCFRGDFDFNISHSGDIAVCAAIMKGKIGTDIEKIARGVSPGQMTEFSEEERISITRDPHPEHKFYSMWTRKEALLKASGLGVFGSLAGIDICQQRVEYAGETYYLYDDGKLDGYQLAFACNRPSGMEIKKGLLDFF